MEDFGDEKEQDVVDIFYDYDENSGNIISRATRERLNKY